MKMCKYEFLKNGLQRMILFTVESFAGVKRFGVLGEARITLNLHHGI